MWINDFIEEIQKLNFNCGESPETLIKVYKWIWGQEDVNYPAGEGRLMSWHSFVELRNSLNQQSSLSLPHESKSIFQQCTIESWYSKFKQNARSSPKGYFE